MKLMKYVENASRTDGTRAIKVGGDRPDINLGGMGEMEDYEIANASAMGHVLVEADDGGIGDMSIKDLEKRASKMGVTFDEDAKKDDMVSVLRQRLASGPEDPAEAANAALVGGTTVGASGGPTGVATGGGPATPTGGSAT